MSIAQDQGWPELVFLFPGQGTQHYQMARELYEREPVFREQWGFGDLGELMRC
jgi:acyl transferase domain-containing protein